MPFPDAREFWIALEEDREFPLLSCGEAVIRIPRTMVREVWSWFLSLHYPGTHLRFISYADPFEVWFTQTPITANPNLFSFRLSILMGVFHPLSKVVGPHCRRAAAWLASLQQDVLWPFDFLEKRSFWADWDRATHSDFRRQWPRLIE